MLQPARPHDLEERMEGVLVGGFDAKLFDVGPPYVG